MATGREIYDEIAAGKSEEAPALTLEMLEEVLAKLTSRPAAGVLRYERGADGLWYVFDQTGAVVLIADDTGYTQLTGEEPPP
jgi:hypothetical protein